MNVSLTPELERLVARKVENGLYRTASEVVREALRLLNQRDTAQARLQGDVVAGLDELDHDTGLSVNARSARVLAREVKRQGRKRMAAAR